MNGADKCCLRLVALMALIAVYFYKTLRSWFGDIEGCSALEPNSNFFSHLCVFHLKLSSSQDSSLPSWYVCVGGEALHFISYLHFLLNSASGAFHDQIAFFQLYLMSCKTCFLFAL